MDRALNQILWCTKAHKHSTNSTHDPIDGKDNMSPLGSGTRPLPAHYSKSQGILTLEKAAPHRDAMSKLLSVYMKPRGYNRGEAARAVVPINNMWIPRAFSSAGHPPSPVTPVRWTGDWIFIISARSTPATIKPSRTRIQVNPLSGGTRQTGIGNRMLVATLIQKCPVISL
jgi:hypothetical protein